MIADRRRSLLILLLLAALAAVPYVQTLKHEFINYDDDQYVSANQVVLKGLTWDGLRWSLTAIQVGNWQPLTALSLMLDCDLYRQADGSQWAGGHHLSSAVFHIANTLLLFAALKMMTGSAWRSAFVAALFAVHPTHVESVAWAAERKDVLSTFFGFLAITAYAWYVHRPSIGRYIAVLVMFALSLLAKPMLVTLPCVLLVLDVWPLRRWRLWDVGAGLEAVPVAQLNHAQPWPWLVIEKLPLLALSAGASVVAIVTQHVSGAMTKVSELPIADRISNAVVTYVAYLDKLAFPRNLAVIYPQPASRQTIIVVACVAILACMTIAVVWLRKTMPWLLTGWLLYLGTLVPVIGLIQVGGQSMADRYLYVPSIGIFIMVAWSIPALQTVPARRLVAAAACAIIVAFTVSSHAQASYWRNSYALFTRTLAVTRENAMAHVQLGEAFEDDGNNQRAFDEYARAVALRPNHGGVRERVASVLLKLNRTAEAMEHLAIALELNPTEYVTHNLGMYLMSQNRLDEAERVLRENVRLDDDNSSGARENYAALLVQLGRFDDARAQFEDALRLSPDSAKALNGLGVVFISKQQFADAATILRRALELDPSNLESRGNFGWVLLQLGSNDEAITHLATVKVSHPERYGVRLNLAKALTAAGRVDYARAELQSILAASPGYAPARAMLDQLTPGASTAPASP